MVLLHKLSLGLPVVLFAGSLMLGAATPAQAQVLENVRVRLPNGQLLTLGDDWQRDPRVITYKRYYYEPQQRTYVVYNTDADRYRYRDNHWQRGDHDDHRGHNNKGGHFCPPGQAKKGRC